MCGGLIRKYAITGLVGVLELGNIDIGRGLFPEITAYRHRLCNEMFVDNVEVVYIEIIHFFLKELYSETFSLYVRIIICVHCNMLLHMYICAFYRVPMITH